MYILEFQTWNCVENKHGTLQNQPKMCMTKEESSNTVFRAKRQECSLAQNCHLLQMGYDYQTFSTFLGEAKYKKKDEQGTYAKTHT